MTTPKNINKKLQKMGIKGNIVRCRRGYYYFTGDLMDKVPSIYAFNLKSYTTTEIIDTVKSSINYVVNKKIHRKGNNYFTPLL